MAHIPHEMIEAAIARYRQERAKALKTLADIESGTTFHQAVGGEQMRDVTAERRADEETHVVQLAALIEAYENLSAQQASSEKFG